MRWVDFKDSVKRFWADYKHQKAGMTGLVFLIILVGLALAAPFITSPDVPAKWQTGVAWITNPKNAPPSWENYFISESKAVQVEYYGKNLNIETSENGSFKVYKLSMPYKMNYDVPPADIVVTGLASNASNPKDNPVVQVTLVRPPEKGIKDNKLNLISGIPLPSNGSIQVGPLAETKSHLLYWMYINGVLNIPNVPAGMVTPDNINMFIMGNTTLYQLIASMDSMRIMFGRVTDDSGNPLPVSEVISNPVPFKGDYKLVLTIKAPKDVALDFSHFKVAFVGRTYGILGTDQYGRPIAVGILWGTRVALAIGLAVSISSVLIGILIGVTSAYLGGWADEAIQRFTEFIMTLPVLPMLILLSLYFGGRINLKQLVSFLVLFGWMGTSKVARSMALQIKEQTYVEAARALGASTGRVVFKHIVPQLLPYAFASIALSVPGAILSEAGLSFLGLTAQNLITWGQMLNAAQNNAATINGYWWQVIPPGLAISFVGLIFVLIGVSLDTVLNPRLKRA
jgi:peptide/nickel transport system permease protein